MEREIERQILSAANAILNLARLHGTPHKGGVMEPGTWCGLEQIEIEAHRILELIVKSGNPPKDAA